MQSLLKHLPGRTRLGRRLPLWVLPVTLVLLALACNRGPYTIDWFPEMHYQSSFRAQEPPRLSPPAGSVPRTGAEVAFDLAEAAELTNPVVYNAANMERASKLYQVNCAACHGATGHGDGLVGEKFRLAGAVPPIDFSQARTKDRSEGELWWIVTNGLGNMPAWKALLTAEERWLLIHFVKAVQ